MPIAPRAIRQSFRVRSVKSTLLSRLSPGVASGRGDASPFSTPKYDKDAKIFDRQYHSPSKVLKLEDDPWGSCAMYSPEKMKSGGGLMAPPGCFPGRYSPTYRTSDPRRCVPNPSLNWCVEWKSGPLKRASSYLTVKGARPARCVKCTGKNLTKDTGSTAEDLFLQAIECVPL
ncbi:unnamed protein product [Pieris brassicae]|uniref:Uncharacterized protein n=1 Tax=Pieris brassicae TaxID=7116 RepID=A0A9P0XLD5_PIEBR|nr:unnamed protein product [Pieris brassicae]